MLTRACFCADMTKMKDVFFSHVSSNVYRCKQSCLRANNVFSLVSYCRYRKFWDEFFFLSCKHTCFQVYVVKTTGASSFFCCQTNIFSCKQRDAPVSICACQQLPELEIKCPKYGLVLQCTCMITLCCLKLLVKHHFSF